MLRRTFTQLSLLACVGTLSLVGCGGSTTESGDGTTDVDVAENTGEAFTKNKETTLRFSAIPDDNNAELKEKFDRVAAYLSEELGVPVEYVPASSYSASVEAFTNGDIQLAWFGGLTGVQARQRVAGSPAIVQGAEDPQYYSYFIAHVDAGIAEWNGEDGMAFPEDALRGKTFTFGSESSTSGRLMPEFFIRENTGESPEEFFGGTPAFSGSHDKTIEAVNSGNYQVGAVNYGTFEKAVAAGQTENCVIVWKTPYYADYNMTAHAELDEIYGVGSIARLQEVLIAMDDPQLLAAFNRSSLIAAKNSEFQGIADVASDLGFLSE
ncbi:MAG: putative selenate ABC transporter substrate-binding protein [Phycisphaerales bacterium JB063]